MNSFEIVIVGGSFGGVAAALAAVKKGKRVLLVEEGTCLGGQVTSQGVPPDEHKFIEEFGATASYQAYRKCIREFYKKNYPVTFEEQQNPVFNPGRGWVSTICHEPRISSIVIDEMLSPYLSNGLLTVWYEATVDSANKTAVNVNSLNISYQGKTINVSGAYFIDATEYGDLLPITETAYITGSESKEMTGEAHAVEEFSPLDMQAVTWCFAVSLEPEGNYVIPKPDCYDSVKNERWDFWPGSLLSWEYPAPATLETVTGSLDGTNGTLNLFDYRRILCKDNFKNEFLKSDITLVNWPQNDYWGGPLFEVSKAEATKNYNMAKMISKCLLYWLQTEADGKGYPNLKPRGDVMGSTDGFALRPYVRESRRIKAEYTILEEDISGVYSENIGKFSDSVGIGYYRLDLHPSTGGRTYIDLASHPFEIPLGAMIPIETENLIPGCKNIGTTHITNGCYRLHPVEWNIGEVSGLLATFAIDNNVSPRNIRNQPKYLTAFQLYLKDAGIALEWPQEAVEDRK